MTSATIDTALARLVEKNATAARVVEATGTQTPERDPS